MLAFRWPSFRLLLACIAGRILAATLAVATAPSSLAQEPVRIDPVTGRASSASNQWVSAGGCHGTTYSARPGPLTE